MYFRKNLLAETFYGFIERLKTDTNINETMEEPELTKAFVSTGIFSSSQTVPTRYKTGPEGEEWKKVFWFFKNPANLEIFVNFGKKNASEKTQKDNAAIRDTFNRTYRTSDDLEPDNFENFEGSIITGSKTPLFISSVETSGESIDLVGVRVFIKFGVMTQLETTQLDGRVRRLKMHDAYKSEFRNIRKYVLFPRIPEENTPTCYKELYDITCRKLSFIDRFNDLAYDIGLSHDAIEDYCD